MIVLKTEFKNSVEDLVFCLVIRQQQGLGKISDNIYVLNNIYETISEIENNILQFLWFFSISLAIFKDLLPVKSF